MATSPEAVRAELAAITATASADLLSQVQGVGIGQQVDVLLEATSLLVPAYYDTAGALAADWYEELREESQPSSVYAPTIIGDPETDWIEREVERLLGEIEAGVDAELERVVAEAVALADKEIARGFRDTVQGNARMDEDAIGWSRIARPGACKLCVMLADKGAVFRSESTAIFAAHTNCNCAARPEFRNGAHGPEASVEQYLASTKRRSEADKARLREYLNKNFPDAPG